MELIDNTNRLLGDDLKESLKPGARLRIAASCFSIYAFEALRNELETIDSLEFIFTSPTFVLDEATDKVAKQRREFHIPRSERERSFYGTEFEIQLKNKLTQRAVARECADWMRRKASFRSNRGKAPMQQFACLQVGETQAVYQPLHGFTAVDLGYQQGDAVSNYVTKFNEAPHTDQFLRLFQQIWQDDSKLEDVSERLHDHIASVYRENSPERIYFFMLYNIFNEFLEDLNEDVLPNDRTGYQNTLVWQKLFNFQRDAATGIINKLETYSGCILADSVGLGKTFTALAVIKYYELRNKSVLVLCPKKLSDNWINYNRNLKTNLFVADRFSYDVLCHTDLQRTTGESLGMPLDRINWGNYDLIVIDESHNFRNNDAYKDRETRYQKLMNKVIRQGVKTKVLMLSATPVNNRFNDLRNQLALAYEGREETLRDKLRVSKSIDEIFRRAQAAFNTWSQLSPEARTTDAILDMLDFDFFDLLDSVTIARSRRHIETFYDTADIGKFPERLKPISIRAPLTSRQDVIGFNDIFQRLSSLKLAVYAPVSYILPSRLQKYEDMYDTEVSSGGGTLRQADREKSLQRLMTVNLLKRLESSVASFRITLEKLQSNHTDTLSRIERYAAEGRDSGIFDNPNAWENVDPDDDDLPDLDDASIGGKVKIELADMDLPRWQHDLGQDLAVIGDLLSEMEKISPADDTKLQRLKAQIDDKLATPINQGNKKVLIFTAFADTADYLYQHLAPALWQQHQLHAAIVTGTSSPRTTLRKGMDFQTVLTVFSPKSKQKDLILPDEPGQIDVLIGTDCISEGQNLQDCDCVINYDIHWNPVRIIQRFGRIDRIGSTNASIQLVNFWPDITLDEYINLKERVENRMVIADVVATADDNVLRHESNDVAYRKEQLRRLQDEVIELEDLKTGVAITDLGLNDFRMDLLNYLKSYDDLGSLPTGMHAVVPADPARGLHPGTIFALRNRHHGINIQQQNRLHPYYLVYVGDDGQIVANHTQVKVLLDLARAACKDHGQPDAPACRLFNQATDDGRDMAAYSALLDQAIAAIIDVKADKDLDSLFTGRETSALTGAVAGLDDFELVCFLVVQAMP
ncbi:MAG: SNF2-related protein [Chloroflexota bacterium]|nr:SNF2-related protein [Chloroflexota bacterium]